MSLPLKLCDNERVLSAMVGQNVLQTSFSTSGLSLIVFTLCAALKALQTSVGKQSCVQLDDQLVCKANI